MSILNIKYEVLFSCFRCCTENLCCIPSMFNLLYKSFKQIKRNGRLCMVSFISNSLGYPYKSSNYYLLPIRLVPSDTERFQPYTYSSNHVRDPRLSSRKPSGLYPPSPIFLYRRFFLCILQCNSQQRLLQTYPSSKVPTLMKYFT